MDWQPIETAPDGYPGFIAAIITDDGGAQEPYVAGIEWLQGPVTSRGLRLCLNSNNYNSFKATHWMPLPEPPATG